LQFVLTARGAAGTIDRSPTGTSKGGAYVIHAPNDLGTSPRRTPVFAA
jgi:hypothetical protein